MGRGLRLFNAIVLVVMSGSMLGCKYEQLQAERDSLWSQNQELQNELSQTRLALEAAQSDRDRLLAQRDELRNKVNVIATGAAANTGFNQIPGVEAVRSADRITVRVPGDVLFSPGKTTLRKSARKTLDDIAQVIERDYPHNTIQIKGYTDTDPIKKSKWADNLELSLQRAAAVHRYLQKKGVDPQRMEAVGLGPWHPRASKAKSRRVEIVVILDQ